MQNENSIIPYPKVAHIRYYIANLHYRNPHLHNAFEIPIILDGFLCIRIDKKKYTFRKNDIVILNPNDVHEFSCESGSVVFLCLHVSPAFCREYLPGFGHTEFLDCYANTHLPDKTIRQILDLFNAAACSYWRSSTTDTYKSVAFTCLALSLLAEYVPNREIDPGEYVSRSRIVARMNRIIQFVDEHHAESNVLSKLAEHEGLSPTYMSHFFSDHFHVPFQKYLLHFRLEKAMHLLCTTNYPILDLCYECGFYGLQAVKPLLPTEIRIARQFLPQLKPNHLVRQSKC